MFPLFAYIFKKHFSSYMNPYENPADAFPNYFCHFFVRFVYYKQFSLGDKMYGDFASVYSL